ncbi:hypothetical protein [Actinoplanes sp. TFC3]|uniref:hypothetical protein n=1 Tax=Actinoplanes sp. TFC3 TaxID=1710355 RepID=UPI00082D67D6|nr:hypothetical protein [Actinoplanes sp. TFC3]
MREEQPENAELTRRTRRRKQALAGVAGLAVLGAGAYAVTSRVADDNQTETRETAALAPAVVSSPPSQEPTASPESSVSVKPSATPNAAPTTSPAPRTDKQRIKAAQSARAHATNAVRPPLPPAVGADPAAASDITVAVNGSARDKIEVYSARADLTGQKQLRWVTDDNEQVGDARCTSKIRLSANVEPTERPTLLICWRTSAGKSVYTVAVRTGGRPSKDESVAAIDKEWKRLG